jgi:hypothetical protein
MLTLGVAEESFASAGIGMFSFLPGGTVSGNVVINNQVSNNGLGGSPSTRTAPAKY